MNTETREKIYRQIEEKHKQRLAECSFEKTDYFIDKASYPVNFPDSACILCAKNNRGLNLEKTMQIAGFYKIDTRGSISGHCVGTSALFVKYIVSGKPAGRGCIIARIDIDQRPSIVNEVKRVEILLNNRRKKALDFKTLIEDINCSSRSRTFLKKICLSKLCISSLKAPTQTYEANSFSRSRLSL